MKSAIGSLLPALLHPYLLAVGCGGAIAQSKLEAASTIFPAINPAGEVSVAELAAQPAVAQRASRAIEMPNHLLPDGSTTLNPRTSISEQLPPIEPNVSVTPNFGSVKGFIGIHSIDNVTANGAEFEPPDQGLAVNNNVAAEINNLVVRFFNAASGAALSNPIAASSFFKATAGSGLTDPQAFFDPTTKRWFLTVIESNAPIFTGGSGSVEKIDIAVSKTSSPLGSYFIYHVRAASKDLPGCGALDCLPDYPKAGYDANGFYVSVDLFNASSGDLVAAATYAVSKSKLEGGAGATPIRFAYPNDFVVQPSVPAPGEPFETRANGTEYLMEARNIVDFSHNIRVWAISNTNNIVTKPSSLRTAAIDIPAEAYASTTVPQTEPNVIGPYCKSQGVTSAPLLDGGYAAFQATIQKANGKLSGALAFRSRDSDNLLRNVLAWFVLKPSVSRNGVPSASIFKQGYVVPGTGYSVSYPAFGLDKSGAGVLGFTITNKSRNVTGGFPSAAFIQFSGTGTTAGIVVSGPGATSDDGFTGCPGPGPG
ncbi:MAG: hypothetical protein J2P49_05350, partial [Methylocapsa sp.]|nr:hypothetical protein [Methylocapsa sp.]